MQYEPAIEVKRNPRRLAVKRLGREHHHLHHAEIVEQAQHGVQHADEQQRPKLGHDQRAQKAKNFAEKPANGGMPTRLNITIAMQTVRPGERRTKPA